LSKPAMAWQLGAYYRYTFQGFALPRAAKTIENISCISFLSVLNHYYHTL
jgi:hypothetical protein